MSDQEAAISEKSATAGAQPKVKHPALWVISNYIAMGIPFSMVIWVSTRLFKDLGHSDTEITVEVAMIGIVWSLKPFWAGFLDMFKTKKFFVLTTEFFIGVLFALMGFSLMLPAYFTTIIALMWIVAFASATQDICSDGIYISSLNKARQAAYIGVQGMAWNLGRVIATAAIVWFAGFLKDDVGMTPHSAWMYALLASGALMALFGLYHMPMLPVGSLPEEKQRRSAKDVVNEFLDSAADFCNKRALWGMLAFVFLYRSSEGLLLIEAPLFMQGCLEDGALQVDLKSMGIIDGTVSTIVSILGGLLGGVFISKFTLKRTLLILALCVNVPNLCYVYLSHAISPENHLSLSHIAFIVSLEKFWYGFGFVGNMLYMMQQIAPGHFKMTHYAFATAFMNLVLVPTQMASGPLADMMGFKEFFWLVMVAIIPSMIAAYFAPFPQLKAPNEDIAVDDNSLLDDNERKAQAWARRATIYALLSAMVFLYPGVMGIGWMSSTKSGGWLVFFLGLLGVVVVLTFVLAILAIVHGRSALSNMGQLSNGKSYRSNALGSVIAGGILVAVSVVLSWTCYNKASSTDWDCAFSEKAAQCLQPDAGPKKLCKVKKIERDW